MKVILKDNSIYSVGSWNPEKNKWLCQGTLEPEKINFLSLMIFWKPFMYLLR